MWRTHTRKLGLPPASVTVTRPLRQSGTAAHQTRKAGGQSVLWPVHSDPGP